MQQADRADSTRRSTSSPENAASSSTPVVYIVDMPVEEVAEPMFQAQCCMEKVLTLLLAIDDACSGGEEACKSRFNMGESWYLAQFKQIRALASIADDEARRLAEFEVLADQAVHRNLRERRAA